MVLFYYLVLLVVCLHSGVHLNTFLLEKNTAKLSLQNIDHISTLTFLTA